MVIIVFIAYLSVYVIRVNSYVSTNMDEKVNETTHTKKNRKIR